MNNIPIDFFCFILPGGTTFPCSEQDGKILFPWRKAMDFIKTAREVFSSHQIDNAFGYTACDEFTEKFEAGERSLDFMYEVAAFVERLRKRWNLDSEEK
jgi:hypothetical protein